MVEFVVNEIDKIQNNNSKLSKKLKEIKTKTIKEIIYSNNDVPSNWATKVDYNQLLTKLVANDEKLVNYLGVYGEGALKNNNNNKKNLESKNSTNKGLIIKENGRVFYPNYLRQNIKHFDESNELRQTKNNIQNIGTENGIQQLKTNDSFEEQLRKHTHTSTNYFKNNAYQENILEQSFKKEFHGILKNIDGNNKNLSTNKEILKVDITKNPNQNNNNNNKLQKKSLASELYLGTSASSGFYNSGRLKSAKKSTKQRIIEASKKKILLI